MKRKEWTSQEVEFLKANCKSTNLDALSVVMNRSRSSINNKMRMLGLYTDRLWSEPELVFLRANFGKMTSEDVGKTIGRTASCINNQARRLGLVHDRWWTQEDDDFLRLHYGVKSKKQIAKTLGRTESGVGCRAITLGIARIFQYPPERFCADCGSKLSNKYMTAKHCRKCQYKHNTGENNPRWKGGVSTLYKLIQRNLWEIWKFPILKRDNFECQTCGYHGKFLEVHHKRRLVEIRDMILAANPHLAINVYEERVELAQLIVAEHKLQDGITLCKKCHRAIHTSKPGELSGNSVKTDNQQPSPPNLKVIVGGKVQRLTGEDSETDNPDTSARHTLQRV